MVSHRIPVFDGDGHVYENEADIAKYFEGDYKNVRRFETFSIFPSLDGFCRGLVLEKINENREYTYTNAAIWGEMLDKIGAEGSVLYPTAGLAFGLMQEPSQATAVAIAYNNWLEAEYTKKDERLYGAAMVPVQDPVAAAKEIERCAKARVNFPAVYLPSVTNTGKTYGDAFFDPIYKAAEKFNIPLALHGGPSRGMGFDHFMPFLKIHTLEHPFPLMIQLTDIILSGVFDRFPKLRIAFLEGGCGWVPFMADRLDYEVESVFGVTTRNMLKRKPSEYICDSDNFWVSMELGEKSLKYAIDMMGSDRILYASDYPHEPTEEELVADVPTFIDNPDFDDTVKKNCLYDNQKRFYNLS